LLTAISAIKLSVIKKKRKQKESALSFICVLGLSNLTLSSIFLFYCNLILHFNERNLIPLVQKWYIHVTVLHHWNN